MWLIQLKRAFETSNHAHGVAGRPLSRRSGVIMQ